MSWTRQIKTLTVIAAALCAGFVWFALHDEGDRTYGGKTRAFDYEINRDAFELGAMSPPPPIAVNSTAAD